MKVKNTTDDFRGYRFDLMRDIYRLLPHEFTVTDLLRAEFDGDCENLTLTNDDKLCIVDAMILDLQTFRNVIEAREKALKPLFRNNGSDGADWISCEAYSEDLTYEI